MTDMAEQHTAEGHRPGDSPQRGAQLLDRLDGFADLSQYSFRQRLIIRLAGLVLYWLIRVIGATMRFEVIGGEHVTGNRPRVFCFWHNRIPIATYFWRRRGIVVMSSRSFDSEYIARFIQRFGYGAARGSSTRGGKAALIQMIRAVRAGRSAAFSVDGPRGPLYLARPGALLLAAKTGAEVLPFSISLDRCWRLRSWDRIEIPKPFARAVVVIGQPFTVPDTGIDETHEAQLQQALDNLRRESDALIAGKRPAPGVCA
ncbi:MAG: lysophospholipid acyltransferase family protein [Blastocatellia bacterium]